MTRWSDPEFYKVILGILHSKTKIRVLIKSVQSVFKPHTSLPSTNCKPAIQVKAEPGRKVVAKHLSHSCAFDVVNQYQAEDNSTSFP